MPADSKATLEAIKYAPGSLELLDQRLLPTKTVFLPVPTTAVAYDHIKDMVRLPPAACRAWRTRTPARTPSHHAEGTRSGPLARPANAVSGPPKPWGSLRACRC